MLSQLTTGFEFVFAFVLMLGVLITVHEFGHFIVAKMCGVRVLKFSIGFGSPIGIGRFRLAWHRSGTDYVIAWIPLGGFVKLLGENMGDEDEAEAENDRAHSLDVQPTWKKLAIYFAGPAMNLMLPVVLLLGTLWVGIDRAASVIGTVEPASPAAAAGLEPGDRILALNGEPVEWWEAIDRHVRENPGRDVRFTIERDGQVLERELRIETEEGIDRVFRNDKQIGWLGLQHPRQKAVLGFARDGTRAAAAGLHPGDRVVRVGDLDVEDWPSFERAYRAAARAGASQVPFRVARGGPETESETELTESETELTVEVPVLADLDDLGVIPAVVLVQAVSPDMPAARAGLAAGDLLLSVDGREIGSFMTFRETVLGSGGRPLEIRFVRGGEVGSVMLEPEKQPSQIEGLEQDEYLIGIQGANAILQGSVSLDRVRNPIIALPRAVGMTWDATRLYLRGLEKLITGDISRKALGGPIEIAKQSHSALQKGWDTFLNLLMFISINLGILNLLPIPVLDGGQIVLILVESVKRGPLSLRTREFVQSIGVVLLMALMGFAFWNDVSRYWSTFFEWVRGL